MASTSRELSDAQVLDFLEEKSADCSDTISEDSIGYNFDSSSDSEEEETSQFSENIQENIWEEVDSANPPLPFACDLVGKQIVNVQCTSDPLDYFELFFNDDLITIIVTETNHYAEQFLAREKDKISTTKVLSKMGSHNSKGIEGIPRFANVDGNNSETKP